MKKESDIRQDSGTTTLNAPFSTVKYALARQFELMKEHQLFRIDLSGPQAEFLSPEMRAAYTGDLLWNAYLEAFPPGTNPKYKERTDHDCSCCKGFIRQMGGVVAIIHGVPVSIWNFAPTGTFYDDVGVAMAKLAYSAVIDNIFLHTEKCVGTEKNFQQVLNGVPLPGNVPNFRELPATSEIITWEHFHLHLPKEVVVKKEAVGPKQSDARAAHDVLKRGLEELTLEAVDTVLELIAQNSLYKGEESKAVLMEFRRLKVKYDALDHEATDEAAKYQHYFIWANIGSFAARIRNTAIGTLLIDLSTGMDMEEAVAKFEAMVAPQNYKRPTALVTKAMVAKAQAKIEELGLTSALERRYAVLDDIRINNVLFADRSRTQLRKDNVFADILGTIPEAQKTFDKVADITIDEFLIGVLPNAKSLEVLVENGHVANLVSLVAPVDPGAKHLFKWPNNFSWSYKDDVADSLKERVKKAGGSVVGDLCCRLAWGYTDDLDFHMQEPGGKTASIYTSPHETGHICYRNVRRLSINGGMLDVDANGCDGMKDDPVENIFYETKRSMREGTYVLSVNNYSRRSDGAGFEAEVEVGGRVHSFTYPKALRTDQTVEVARITYSKLQGFTVESKLESKQTSKKVWGVSTNVFQKVNVVMLSPNYWDRSQDGGQKDSGFTVYPIGNKHYFFMLDGCANEEGARGFYNEFLSSELEPHRKTMEMVGAKMRTEGSERQLSGLGFSSTQRNALLVKVQGTFTRVLKVVF